MNQLSELRSIIVGEQQKELKILKKRLDESLIDAQKVAAVMPESMRLSMGESGKLKAELRPFVATTVIETVEKESEKFAEVLYPVLVPAIRLMIANSVRSFVKSMNHTIESATTIQGIKWRIESAKTGVPYSEVALRKTLEYRVEQVFLIEKDAGLLIEHLINENVEGLDSDAVAAMFSAIQSFVKESFSSSTNDESLTQMNVGELNVWLVHSSSTILACVIRGNAPYELRDQLELVQDNISSVYARELRVFDGSGEINGVHELLEPCLQLKLKEFGGGKNKAKKTPLMSYVVMLSIVSALLFSMYSEFQSTKIQKRVESLLFVTPGLLPTKVEWDKGVLQVSGLKDPDAEIPWDEFDRIGVDKAEVNISLKTLKSYAPLKNNKKEEN